MSKPQLTVETLWPETVGPGPLAIPSMISREKGNDSPLIAEDGAYRSIVDSKRKVDELFFKWLCEPGVKEEVHELIRQAREGTLALSPSRRKALTSPRGSPGKEPPRSPSASPLGEKSKRSAHFNSPGSPRSTVAKKSPLNHSSSSSNNSSGDVPAAEKLDSVSDNGGLAGEHASAVPSPASPSTPPVGALPPPPSAPVIPPFYIPNEGGRGRGRRIAADRLETRKGAITELFGKNALTGIKSDDFVTLTKEFCGLPSFLSTPLHIRVQLLWARVHEKRLDVTEASLGTEGLVTLEMFCWFWKHEVEPYDATDRFFRLLKRPEADVIYPADFEVVLKELLAYHPGLEFLENTPEFQEKYARTVVARIFYSTDRTRCWQLRRRDVRRSDPNMFNAFIVVDEEEDINMVHHFFSYEHFYVLYCKFWELDTDHDFYLTRDDVLRYSGHSLTRRIVDRIFEQAGRPFISDQPQKMAYEDFVFFMLSEEDKNNRDSMEYWFQCIDLDGDGEIHPHEMRSFYNEQLHRMECLGHEMVSFESILTQMMDIVNLPPDGPAIFRMEDFCGHGAAHMGLSSVVFNMLFNLNKFVAYEQRDPFMMKQARRDNENMTTWAQFAVMEYARLAMEEEAREEDEF